MNRLTYIYVGALLLVAASFTGLVGIPQAQLESLTPHTDEMGSTYPVEPGGVILTGREIYVDMGCLYCHSQQVRPEGFGADIDRGWGARRTVARDYLFDQPPLLGTMRTGPDLANIGVRQPSESWHLLHLYNPKITSEGSLMAPFPFLFEVKDGAEVEMAGAVELPDGWGEPGQVLVPSEEAEALLAYLKSLKRDVPLPEAP